MENSSQKPRNEMTPMERLYLTIFEQAKSDVYNQIKEDYRFFLMELPGEVVIKALSDYKAAVGEEIKTSLHSILSHGFIHKYIDFTPLIEKVAQQKVKQILSSLNA